MINIDNLKIVLNKDQRIIVDAFSLQINFGDRIAIIGEEGNGKSSILKAIADPKNLEDYATFEIKGNILKRKIAYVSQNINLDMMHMSVYDYMVSKNMLNDLDYTLMYQIIDRLKALDPFEHLDRLLESLSGGERMKFFIVCALMEKSDVLILDEPSNDLDIDSIYELESILIQSNTPLIFVSHDEAFLERVSNRVVHLELIKHKQESRFTISNFDYKSYIKSRSLALVKQEADYKNDRRMFAIKEAKYQKLHQEVEHKLRSVSRQDPGSAKNLKDKMRSIKSMGKRYEKEKSNLSEKVVLEDVVTFKMNEVKLYDNQEIIDVSIPELKVDSKLLSQNINLKIYGPRKIVIIGKNGVGKTSLLKELMGKVNPRIRHFYLAQDFLGQIPKDKSALEFLSESGDKSEIEGIRTLLGSLNFTAEEMVDKLENLSGGQLIKVSFEKMRRSQARVLFIDEPTRNLSPLTRPVMVNAIKDFKGAVIAVSHDRDFIRKSFDSVYGLNEKGLREKDIELI